MLYLVPTHVRGQTKEVEVTDPPHVPYSVEESDETRKGVHRRQSTNPNWIPCAYGDLSLLSKAHPFAAIRD